MSSMNELKRLAQRAMRDRGFLSEFPPEVLRQADSVAVAPASGPGVQDLRALPWISIDNDDSLDLDQLSTAEAVANSASRLRIAIADVDTLVQQDSAIDRYARENTTSVYTAAQIFPMLPEKLSTDLTSLADHRERLAIVVDMTITEAGIVTQSDVYRALVFNHAKLAYNSVSAWLDGAAPIPQPIAQLPALQEQIHLQEAISNALRKVRHTQGAMTLETTQAETVFSAGVLSDLRPSTKNRARELVEDQMVAANGVTARFLESQGFVSIRRILQTPKRWDRIVALAASFGEHLPETPDVIALSAFMEHRRSSDPTHYADVSLSVIKMLGSGEYGIDVPGRSVEGHFGLAVGDYTHSTAPNRRFPDLVTQRLLKAAIAKQPSPYSEAQLREIAVHCTEREDEAAKVERQVRKSAAATLLQPHVGQQFDAIVTGASAKGTWVRINHPVAEGKLVQGAQGLDVGDRVRVKLNGVDVERGYIDFGAIH
ncbi:MAG: RNB domain-containing ribonuclease [Povalibacter sp.]